MSGFLTTHILDTALGCPAQGIKIELYQIENNNETLLNSIITNDDGRTDSPILGKEDFKQGNYKLIFHVKEYHLRKKLVTENNIFLNQVPIIFTMSEDAHYHVPLLLSPFSYTTYRGS